MSDVSRGPAQKNILQSYIYSDICYKKSIMSQVNYCLQLEFKQRGRVLLSIKSLGFPLIVTGLIVDYDYDYDYIILERQQCADIHPII